MKLPQFSIGSFVLGVIITIAVYHGYVVYKLKTLTVTTANQVQINDNRLVQIENFLNNAIAKQQKNISAKKQAPKQAQKKKEEKKESNKEEK